MIPWGSVFVVQQESRRLTWDWPRLNLSSRLFIFSSIHPSYRAPRPRLNIKTVLSTYGDFHVKDKTIPGKTVFLIETAPWYVFPFCRVLAVQSAVQLPGAPGYVCTLHQEALPVRLAVGWVPRTGTRECGAATRHGGSAARWVTGL